jgi:hypothetical protein
MPFEHLTPRPLTVNGVQTYAPNVSGVYGISNACKWIFIGQSADIKTALLTHLRDDAGMLATRGYVGFVYERCAEAYRSQRQEQLAIEYTPAFRRFSPRISRTALQRRQDDK